MTAYFWFFVAISTITVSILIKIAAVIPSLRKTNVRHEIAIRWGKTIFGLIPFWSYKVSGKENAKDDCYVIVANHSHLTDIWALYLTELNFRWVAKKELFRVPFLGSAMKNSGYIAVDRKSRISRANSIAESKKHLDNRNSMLIFPEGKRNLKKELLTFKAGAFNLSKDHNIKVLPIYISGANSLFKDKSLIPKKGHIHMEILEAVEIAEDETIEEFSIRTRDILSKEKALLDKAGL